MDTNLISVSKLSDDRFDVAFANCHIAIGIGESCVYAKKKQGLYVLPVKDTEPVAVNQMECLESTKASLREVHRALSHISKRKVRETLNQIGTWIRVSHANKGNNTNNPAGPNQASAELSPQASYMRTLARPPSRV